MDNLIIPCFFQSDHLPVSCDGSGIQLGNLLYASSSPKDFRSMLEYLLSRAAFFDLEKTNLCQFGICENHYKYLTAADRQDNCKLCKTIRQRPTSSTNSLRLISKSLAFKVWQEGHPVNTWAVYGQSACTTCRKHFEASTDFKETASVGDRIFDWIYDENIVYLPVPSEPASQRSNFQPQFEHLTSSQRQDGFDTLKRCLIETGYMGRVERTLSYTTLTDHSRCNIRNQMEGIMQHVLKLLSEENAENIWKEILNNNESNSSINQSEINDAMMSLSNAYANADHFSTKRQILAIVAPDFPPSILKVHFSGASDDLIKEARTHAYQHGRGAPVEIKQKFIQRYDEEKLLHFFQFVLSPTVTMDLPFGIKHLKLTTGQKIDVPDTIRNTIHSRIIRQYHSFCQETTTTGFKPLGDTTLFAILKGCSASIRKSLAGLDSYSTNGSTAFDILTTVCEELAIYRVSVDQISHLKKVLRQCRNYLKLEYKLHIAKSSSVPDHCSTYALGDSTESDWCNSCHDHDHNDRCEDCVLLDNTLNYIKSLIDNNIHLPENQRSRYQSIFKRQHELIQEWKKHQLRTVHQETAKDWVLEQLDETSAFIQIDWAMKWLQLKYRESQNGWFAKKGLPWHLTHVIRVNQSSTNSSSVKSFEHRTICHVFNYCGQTGRTVVSILRNIFKDLRLENPKLDKVYLRADNAGCYHGSEFILAVKKLYDETGVLIRRIDFSEAQAGKGKCDRDGAVMKGEVRRHVNEKNDCCNNVQFVAAAKSTQHLSIFACNITDVNKNKVSLPHITKYNNIQFELCPGTPGDLLMTTWRAFEIGVGKQIRYSSLKSTVDTIETLEIVSQHSNAEWKVDKIMKEEMDNDVDDEEHAVLLTNNENDMDVDQPSIEPRLLSSGFYLFDCTDPQCTKQFRRYSNLEKHLTTGKHVYTSITIPLLDRAKLLYKELIESDTNRVPITLNQFNSITSTTQITKLNKRLQGWAIAIKKASTRFSNDVITFLTAAFDEGVATGNKWEPVALSQEMVFADLNGRPRFIDNDCLTPEQIKAFFSNLKSKRTKQGSQSQINSSSSQSQKVNSSSSQSQVNSSSSQPTLSTSVSSNNNYYLVNDNTSNLSNALNVDSYDDEEQQTLTEEEINELDSLLEATQLGHLRSLSMEIMDSTNN